MLFRGLILIFLCVALTPNLYAQSADASPENKTVQPAKNPSHEEQLRTLLDTIKQVESEDAQLSRELKRTKDPANAQQINQQIDLIEKRLQDLKISFGELATGGFSISALDRRAEEAQFNWQKELEAVVQPLLEELKRLTERPRIMERLKSEQALYKDQLQIIESAITELEKKQAEIKAPVVDKALKSLLGQWQDQRGSVEDRLQRINVQLERLTAPDKQQSKGLLVTLEEFAHGRGLNLALALGGFILTYLILGGFGHLVGNLTRRGREPGPHRMGRVIAWCFRLLTLALALFVTTLILYVQGDWLLLGLLVLIVIGLLWGLRQSLPRYMREIRTLLDMGGVREGERVIYNGAPWKITSLNLYSTLQNSLLRGGSLRLPLDRMVDLQSRPYALEEPWFPSQENDIVILDGDIYGKVLLQTPEIVQLQVVGSTTTFPIAEYLGKNPRNLSRDGFAVPVVFGLDYQHQHEILSTIVPTLRAYLEAQLEEQPFRPHLTNLLVEFNEAASSSLNLLIVAVFTGAGAGDYWPIRRFLQRATVSACNRYGWTIPFDQLTVHLPVEQPTSCFASSTLP
ncbi:MAG: hypothetical protein H6973_09130 [Gammaproteobacteria bacterium]|nr:hypothetical protein [Gammaproteobacteria bacterium]HRX69626.1 hypothetical protein [Candidatus Competibacteraceae bacterium]